MMMSLLTKVSTAAVLLLLLVAMPRPAAAGPMYLACFGTCSAACVVPSFWNPVLAGVWTACIQGCSTACAAACFHPNSTVVVVQGSGYNATKMISKPVTSAVVGDRVLAFDPETNQNIVTTIVGARTTVGTHEFVGIELIDASDNTTRRLVLTSSHQVIVVRNGQQLLLSASKVRHGDLMISSSSSSISSRPNERLHFLVVTEIPRTFVEHHQTKTTLVTESGTIVASTDVVVSTMCGGDENKGDTTPSLLVQALRDWKEKHRSLSLISRHTKP